MSDAGVGSAAVAPVIRLRAEQGPPLGAIFGGIGVLAAAAAGLLASFRSPFPLCVMKVVSGIPCPSCGSTRALACLAHLDPAGAFAMNPLAAAAAFLVGAWAAADLLLLPTKRALRLELRQGALPALRGAVALAIALNWVYLVAAGR